jgi:hypothetical protein
MFARNYRIVDERPQRERSLRVVRRLIGLLLGIVSLALPTRAIAAEGPVPTGVAAWEALWTSVLSKVVDGAGRIDFVRLKDDHADLDRVVAFIAAVDPDSQPARFPDRSSRLAYYINAYNALAMHGVLAAGVPESLGGLRKLTFFVFRTFAIGGVSRSLYGLENDVIRPLGEERVHFALNCMVVGCPRLPREAFTANKLEQQLDDAAREFINEDRNVRVDRDRRKVWLSAIFDFYTKDFLLRAPSLIAYVNRYRTKLVPTNFKVRFLDYDWSANDGGRMP